MSKKWRKDTVVSTHIGLSYDDKSTFEIIYGDFENDPAITPLVEKRLGIRWIEEDGSTYPRGSGFALPSRKEDLEALRDAINNFLDASQS